MARKGDNFYRRDPAAALAGMASMSLEERGVYNTIIDLLYLTWRPLENDRRYIAGHCGCAVQRLNPILERLIERGKLVLFEERGQTFISNARFEEERAEFKGKKTRRQPPENQAGPPVEVGEKSDRSLVEVEENSPLLGYEPHKNHEVVGGRKKERKKEDPLIPLEGERADLFDQAPDPPSRRKPKRPIPAEFPSPELIEAEQAKATEAGANVDIGVQAARFRNWAVGKDARYADWTATWRNWAERAIREAPRSSFAVPAPADPADQWGQRLREWTKNRYWREDDWGPKPGRLGCEAPPDLMRRHGVDPATALPFAVGSDIA